jgi:hypothetical protein
MPHSPELSNRLEVGEQTELYADNTTLIVGVTEDGTIQIDIDKCDGSESDSLIINPDKTVVNAHLPDLEGENLLSANTYVLMGILQKLYGGDFHKLMATVLDEFQSKHGLEPMCALESQSGNYKTDEQLEWYKNFSALWELMEEDWVDNNCSEMQVVVLNDGETYTGLKGSKILTIPTYIDENDVDTYVKDNYKDGVDIQ